MGAKGCIITIIRGYLFSLLIHLLLILLLWWLFWHEHPKKLPQTSTPIRLSYTRFIDLSSPSTPSPVPTLPRPTHTSHHKQKVSPKPTQAAPTQQRTAKHTKAHRPVKTLKATPLQPHRIMHQKRKQKSPQPYKKRKTLQRKRDAKPQKQHLAKKIQQAKVKRHHTKTKRHYKDALASALMGGALTHKVDLKRVHHSANAMIHKLYGKQFLRFTPEQKRFIRTHLDEIYRITQNTLIRHGYPDVAVRTRQQGTNVVSFYLHPNGDISHLRLDRRIGYSALDRNTLEVIRLAYMHYPHPKQKTLIRFYVTYELLW